MTQPNNEPEWWQAAFQREYLDIYAHRDDASAAAEVAGVLSMLDGYPQGPVLDACCGNGRHLEALVHAGCDAYGFDWSIDLLQAARKRSATHGRTFRADMRTIPTAHTWSAICLFFTAFGYFDDAENAKVFAGLSQRLRADGLLMLDLPPESLLDNELPPANSKEISGGMRVDEDRAIRGSRVEKNVCIYRDEKLLRSYTESVRIYSRSELEVMAAASKMKLIEQWSSLRGPHENDGRAVYWFRLDQYRLDQ
ncbi:MAG: class I SAM-dependent methyltransferase [Planctomycetes bacterium]|nr:class I SAM-dependent methyltransferase [Planctomycetota bacterium]